MEKNEKLNILVIATGYPRKLLDTIAARGHEYTSARPDDFDLFISDTISGHDACYMFGNKLIASKYDAVITRIGEKRDFSAKIIRHLQHNLSMFCVQSGNSILTCADKWKSAQMMSEAKIQVPRQFMSLSGKYPAFYIEKLGGLPVILKELSGSKGKGLIKLADAEQTNMTLESYFGTERKIILQEYLNNSSEESGGSDERHIVCGGRVVNSMRRHAPKNDIRANLSLSGSGEAITADDETAEMAVKAVATIPGLNFAGVDIMKIKNPNDETKEKRYFIEINSNPGEKIIDITGHNHYEDLLDFVEAECKRRAANKKADAEEARISPDGEERGAARSFDEAAAACRAFIHRGR